MAELSRRNPGQIKEESTYEYFQLFHAASNRMVQMPGENVLLTKHCGNYSLLKAKSMGFNSTVTIQGAKSNVFLCFGKKQRPRLKSLFNKNCIFQEVMDGTHWVQLKQRGLTVGFNKKGRPIAGDLCRKKRSAALCKFQKVPVGEQLRHSRCKRRKPSR